MQASYRPENFHSVTALFLAAALFLGLAQIALLPPWEGFDETAHFSYVQQLAETGRWPSYGAPLAAEIEAYPEAAPMPYGATPPYDRNGHWTYHDFFQAPPERQQQGWTLTHARPAADHRWQPGQAANWQAQHPPLYYALLAPFYRLSASWPLIDQLFLLRTVSLLLAWGALGVTACLALKRTAPAAYRAVPPGLLALAPALWPCLVPMWFPEMARLGNDSLVALWAALAWTSLCRLLDGGGTRKSYVLFGSLCGLGLLTKATFLPFVAVALAALALRLWQVRADARLARTAAQGLALAAAAILVLTSWWFFQKYGETGNLLGANDMVNLAQAGGLWHGLREHGSPAVVINGLINIAISFLWGGTWSFVEPPLKAILPLALTAALVGVGHLCWLRRQAAIGAWVPLATAILFLAGLSYHLMIFIAAYGSGGTPGWYLHSFAPVFSPMLATGLFLLLRRAWSRAAILALCLYPLAFLPAMGFLEALTFSGCGSKQAYANNYDFAAASSCLGDFTTMGAHLALLASPMAAGLLFCAGYACLVVGTIKIIRMPKGAPRSLEAAPAG